MSHVSAAHICLALTLTSVTPALAQHKPKATVKTLSECPLWGSEDKASGHGLLNITKHQKVATTGSPTKVTIDDLVELEDDVVNLNLPLGRGTDLDADQRGQLRNLQAGDRKLSEGDYVQLVGFIADDDKNPRFNTGESVYCNLTGKNNNDIHINIVGDAEDDELSGVVAEMMPYDRDTTWNLTRLRAVRRSGRKVLVTGGLFLDNVHLPHTDCGDDTTNVAGRRVCIDRDDPAAGNPARSSLWEIHPVIDFRVCMRASNKCSADDLTQWVKLSKVSLAALKKFAQ